MIIGMAIIATSFVFVLTTAVVYFSKKKVKSFETKVFSLLLILSLINSIIEFWLCINILFDVPLYSFYNLALNRSFLLFLFFWFFTFVVYITRMSFSNNKKISTKLVHKLGNNYSTKLINYVSIFFTIVILLLLLLPINLINSNGYAYSDGPAIYVLYVVATLTILTCIFSIISNIKGSNFKKFIPFIGFVSCFGILLIGRQLIPGLLLNSFSLAFPTFLMYHTIENPDLKIIAELYDTKTLSDNLNKEKAVFLLDMVERVREPIFSIRKLVEDTKESKDNKYINENLSEIDYISKYVLDGVNKVLDVSKLDERNLSIYKDKYNVENLFKEIEKTAAINIKNPDVKFRTEIEHNIPKHLYGDAIRMKQVINIIINNSIKYTKSGYIELKVNYFVKNNNCRLFICIEDSGEGIKISELNTIFNIKNNEKITSDEETLNLAKSLVNLMNGEIVVNSEYGSGTRVTIILDQKIEDIKKSSNIEIAEKYGEEFVNSKKIFVIDDEKENVDKIMKLLNKSGIIIDTSIWGVKCLEKVRENEKYDLILLDEEMPRLSGIEMLEKLKEIKDFNIPVVVMTNSKEQDVLKKLIEDGFNDYLTKPVDKNDLKEIVNKYLKTK